MKKILLMILSIMFIVLSCKLPNTPIDSKRSGTYVSAKPVNGNLYLTFVYSDGGFQLYYSTDKDGTQGDSKINSVTRDEMSGEDPNYTFQTGVMAGSLQFLSDKIVKVTVTFNEGPTTLKDILCYNNAI